MKHVLFCILLSVFSLSMLLAQSTDNSIHVEFYGVVADDVDKNMYDITKNLYISQLQDMTNITLTDKSESASDKFENFKAAVAEDVQSIALITRIIQSAPDNWVCTLRTKRLATGEEIELVREYNSYYKILTDVKDSVTELINKLNITSTARRNKGSAPALSGNITPEMLAGTWQGEDYISKIVILRGGRGFVIYKNGATMNINIALDNTAEGITVTIKQSDKPNASFFPELPRKVALDNAPSANPVEWKLTLTDTNTMEGTKETLIEDTQSPTGASTGELDVLWTRK